MIAAPDMERPIGDPNDRLLGIYAATAAVALIFPHRPAGWPLLLVLHATALLIAFPHAFVRSLWTRACRRFPAAARTLLDWAPLLLVPALYAELAVLNHAIYDGTYFDEHILALEQRLFGGQPSQTWAAAAPWLWISEPLHAAYLSFYFIVFVPPLILYLQRRRRDFRSAVFALMLTFFAHYLIFIFYPVQGPRYVFGPPGGDIASGYFYQLAHRVLEVGSSQGAAFPSSHVGVAVAQTVITFRLLPRLALPLAGLGLGLAIGAVYGGFHYATDALCGLLLGTVCAFVGLAVHRRARPA